MSGNMKEEVVKEILKEILEKESSFKIARFLYNHGYKDLAKRRKGYIHLADLEDIELDYDEYVEVEHYHLKAIKEEVIKKILDDPKLFKIFKNEFSKEIEKKLEDKRKLEIINKLYEKYVQKCSKEEIQEQIKEFGFVLDEYKQISWEEILEMMGGLQYVKEEDEKVLFRGVIERVEHYVAIRRIEGKDGRMIRVFVHATANSMPVYYKLKNP